MSERNPIRSWNPWAVSGERVMTYGENRYCACGTKLSRYNPSRRKCFACSSDAPDPDVVGLCGCGCGTPTRKNSKGVHNTYADGHFGEKRDVKLNRERAAEIRERAKAGERYVDIARYYGVSLTTVSDVVRGKTWAEKGVAE